MSHFKSVIKDTKSPRTNQLKTDLMGQDQELKYFQQQDGSRNDQMDRINSMQQIGDSNSIQPHQLSTRKRLQQKYQEKVGDIVGVRGLKSSNSKERLHKSRSQTDRHLKSIEKHKQRLSSANSRGSSSRPKFTNQRLQPSDSKQSLNSNGSKNSILLQNRIMTPSKGIDNVSNVSSGSKNSKPMIKSGPTYKTSFKGKNLRSSCIIQPKAQQKIQVFGRNSVATESPTKRDIEVKSSANGSTHQFVPVTQFDLLKNNQISTEKKEAQEVTVDLESSPEHQSEVKEVYKKVKVDLDSSPESGTNQESEIKLEKEEDQLVIAENDRDTIIELQQELKTPPQLHEQDQLRIVQKPKVSQRDTLDQKIQKAISSEKSSRKNQSPQSNRIHSKNRKVSKTDHATEPALSQRKQESQVVQTVMKVTSKTPAARHILKQVVQAVPDVYSVEIISILQVAQRNLNSRSIQEHQNLEIWTETLLQKVVKPLTQNLQENGKDQDFLLIGLVQSHNLLFRYYQLVNSHNSAVSHLLHALKNLLIPMTSPQLLKRQSKWTQSCYDQLCQYVNESISEIQLSRASKVMSIAYTLLKTRLQESTQSDVALMKCLLSSMKGQQTVAKQSEGNSPELKKQFVEECDLIIQSMKKQNDQSLDQKEVRNWLNILQHFKNMKKDMQSILPK